MLVVNFVANSGRSDRPEDWVPEEDTSVDYDICDEISEMPPSAGMHFLLFFTGHHETGCDVVTTKVQGIELSND